ncbi:hypothetical protein Srufu_079360 (plasmid) [Streptomyces libani subsp. rufus]|nr:hypothetical protein Srufu_079360 [Streptomyces libani subsp. rufus]
MDRPLTIDELNRTFEAIDNAALARAEREMRAEQDEADCPTCRGSGADPECDGAGCSNCDQTTGNCPTCAGTGNNPKLWQRRTA